MTKLQRDIGGGVLHPVVEHVGDLSNRVSPMHGFGWGREEALGKAENQLRALRHPYGFEKEMAENIRANASFTGKSVDDVTARINKSMKEYADAHKDLPASNEVQRLGRDAAIAVGEKRFDEAANLLDQFINVTKDESSYIAALKRK